VRGRQDGTEREAGWDLEGGRMGLIGRQDGTEREAGWD
jgi:hypothetical protein